MSRSQQLSAVLLSILLLSAFGAQAAEAAEYVGHGLTRLLSPTRLELQQSKLLVSTSTIRRGEIEEPLGQGKRRDTTSAGITRSAAEPRKNTAEKVAPERTTVSLEKKENGGKFGIYNAIKESVLDLLMPSRKKAPEKIDLSKVQKDGRTEAQHPTSRTQQQVR